MRVNGGKRLAAFKLIPINILVTLLLIIVIYLLFEIIRRKDLLQKVFLLSAFIVCLSAFITHFTNPQSLNRKIMVLSLSLSGITLIIGMIIVYFKGDIDDKQRVRDLAFAVFSTLFILLLIFIIGRFILP
jgi:predicted membrane channel-forming protein YqfA (hemolysin III family)